MATLQRRFLLGAAVTARQPLPASSGEAHFEVIEVQRRPDDVVILRAILTNRRYRVPMAALRDDAQFATGWTTCPRSDAESGPGTGTETESEAGTETESGSGTESEPEAGTEAAALRPAASTASARAPSGACRT